jgi:hypothetical protein
MSLVRDVAAGLPLNRKERYYTGTVFPAIVCAENFAYFDRLAKVIPNSPPLQVNARPDCANVQVFTEYGLQESIFDAAARQRFTVPPKARDMPDILIFVAAQAPVLIALEAKMYDRPTRQALEEQMRRQREVVVDYLALALRVPAEGVVHACLLPEQLLRDAGYDALLYPVVTWEALLAEFSKGRGDDYWLAVLRLALASYPELVSQTAPRREHADAVLAGAQIYERAKARTLEYGLMGRQFGADGDPLLEDLQSGRWRKQRYEVSRATDRPNPNWFPVHSFVARVDELRAAAN